MVAKKPRVKAVYTAEKKLEVSCKGNLSLAARIHAVPKQTLFDWVHAASGPGRRPMAVGTGRTTVLPHWVERDLCDAICVLSGAALPLARGDIQDLAQCVVRGLGIKTPFTEGRPGPDWARGYEKRWKHRFSRRGREGLSYQRARGLTKHNINVFYDMLELLDKEHHFEPQNIWNCDESGFMGSKVKQKVYCSKELKNAYSLEANTTKSLYSVLFCVNAAGTWLPPFTQN